MEYSGINHFHGIVCIVPKDVTEVDLMGYPCAVPSDSSLTVQRFRDGRPYRRSRSLSSLIAGFKAAVTRRVRREPGYPPDLRVWHRRFHDRILRNEREWRIRRNSIARNPERWWQKYVGG